MSNQINKVTSLELSKRMVELGWDYEVERYWVKYKDRDNYYLDTYKQKESYKAQCISDDFPIIEEYPAPDAIEIGERLPSMLRTDKGIFYFDCAFGMIESKKYYEVVYKNMGKILRWCNGNTEAEARGKMWCYLKEYKTCHLKSQ